jgi:hypothetical protein
MLRKIGMVVSLLILALVDVVIFTRALRSDSASPSESLPPAVVTAQPSSTSSSGTSTSLLLAPESGTTDPHRMVMTSGDAQTDEPTTSADNPTAAKSTAGSSTTPVAGASSAPATTSGLATTVQSPNGFFAALPADHLLMDMSDDGYVIRAFRGACTATTSATIQVSGDSGRSWRTLDSAATVVTRVAAREGGEISYVSADLKCQPAQHDSTDGGLTWHPGSAAGTWALDGDPTATSVFGPSGRYQVDCVPKALAAVDVKHAVVNCADGAIRSTGDGGAHWRTVSELIDVAGISFVDAAHGYVLATQPGCLASVLRTADAGRSWKQIACVSGGWPHAIAVAGTHLLVDVESGLASSGDGGVTWEPVG